MEGTYLNEALLLCLIQSDINSELTVEIMFGDNLSFSSYFIYIVELGGNKEVILPLFTNYYDESLLLKEKLKLNF